MAFHVADKREMKISSHKDTHCIINSMTKLTDFNQQLIDLKLYISLNEYANYTFINLRKLKCNIDNSMLVTFMCEIYSTTGSSI